MAIATFLVSLGFGLSPSCHGLRSKPDRQNSLDLRSMISCVSMKVDAVESTPNPSAFLLRLDDKLEGLNTNGLRGETFAKGRKCPVVAITRALEADGVESVFAMGSILTVSKSSSASWETVLPPVIEALGGSTERLLSSGLPSAADRVKSDASPVGGVAIRLQVSQKLPIQVEASGWLGTNPPVRAKLSARFGSAMGLLVGESGDAFFAGRTWLNRGVRYPEVELPDPADALGNERLSVQAALESEVVEVEAAYPDDRLAAIVLGSKGAGLYPRKLLGGAASLLSLADVDRLCDEDSACEASGEAALSQALRELAIFVAADEGVLGARRNAVAYLGGTGGRGGDVVFEAVAGTFRTAKAAGLRRTAGDALSDLGDARAVPLAEAALSDRSTLVRWRAARLLGELGEGAATHAALKQASLEEAAFEVAFEMKDAARKVIARVDGAAGAARGPMWKQIQEGM